jgi:hypothetical protein
LTLQSATVGGQDASVVPVALQHDVTGVVLAFTDRPPELSGNVALVTDEPGAVTVVVFPTDESAWVGYGSESRRLVSVKIDASGRFLIRGLPAGEYLVAAIPDRLASDWRHPATLSSLVATASRVRVRDGERAVVSLTAVRGSGGSK